VILGSDSGCLYEQFEMLEMSELLWSLCEILLIDIVPGLFYVIVTRDICRFLAYVHICYMLSPVRLFVVCLSTVCRL